ncbi:RagB/SusD family nutrient uptake outer membrane protein [Niabella drilacis]|uniref:Starch-binding associating with outer membrane n=1 Tax=Niabella drilacis (strain DSM 25811 / CCM 8410 / CCUG 62505 / LMG 26954 / E90) TaxID=1285928 RepID=A0A1G6ZK43_NIADE|nr:RagB/SusD family nutrient uptake outer membrane protein [Niabella drilacis]SDE02697.1 Starch-binding associating with outer membrane [Niabella drilacis]
MKKIIVSIFATSIMLFSCKKNFLDLTPTTTISDVAILQDSALFEDYVINRYMGIKIIDKEGEGTLPGFGRAFEYSMWSSNTDESIYNNDDGSWLIQRGQIAPENLGNAGAFWGRSYRGIRDCNWALNNIASVTMSDGHKKNIIGELKFLRAFRYQDLIRNYGGAVLVGDRVYELKDNYSDPALFTRASLKASIDYAVAQLDTAAQLLPRDNGGSWPLGRATKGAALALKARLLLYAASPLYNCGTWAAAAKAAQDVIDLKKYAIQDNYSALFIDQTMAGNEIIFGRQYTITAPHVRMEISNGPNGYDGWAGNTPLQNLVDAYQMDDGKDITDATSGYDAAKPYENRDKRFYYTILYNGASYRGRALEAYIPGGRDSKDGPSNWNTTKTGYYLRKFMNDANPIQNPWSSAGQQPWIYIRYAEVLLNYAEAQNEASGPDETVYDAVNQVRQRASVGQPPLPSGLSQTQMRGAIRKERQVELAFEEHRFYDVRRWKIADVVENTPAYGMIITKNANGSFSYERKVALEGKAFSAKNYWLPIPRPEILASDNKLQQNEGYQ